MFSFDRWFVVLMFECCRIIGDLMVFVDRIILVCVVM